DRVIDGSKGVAGLSGAMGGLLTARNAVLKAIAAIDRDIKHLARSSEACRRLMTIPGVGRLTALAFVAAIDEPERFRRSRDVGAYLGLVPRRYQSGELDYTGSISTALRGGQCDADPLPRQSRAQNMGARHCRAINHCARCGLRSHADLPSSCSPCRNQEKCTCTKALTS